MGDTTDNFVGGFLIGVVLLGIFRLMWFAIATAWWLSLFLVLWLSSGVMALIKMNRPAPEIDGAGEYSDDGLRWLDHASGRWYPVDRTNDETCTVYAIEQGFFWKSTALSRLFRRGAITKCDFVARNDATGQIAAERKFPQEARHNITIDHLDPAYAAVDQYGLGTNREWAQNALQELESILTVKGWDNTGDGRIDHWYADVYKRHVIQWNAPLDAPAGGLS